MRIIIGAITLYELVVYHMGLACPAASETTPVAIHLVVCHVRRAPAESPEP